MIIVNFSDFGLFNFAFIWKCVETKSCVFVYLSFFLFFVVCQPLHVHDFYEQGLFEWQWRWMKCCIKGAYLFEKIRPSRV